MTALPPPGWRPSPRPGRPYHHGRLSPLKTWGDGELLPVYPSASPIASFLLFYPAFRNLSWPEGTRL